MADPTLQPRLTPELPVATLADNAKAAVATTGYLLLERAVLPVAETVIDAMSTSEVVHSGVSRLHDMSTKAVDGYMNLLGRVIDKQSHTEPPYRSTSRHN